jgi:hypothetical protein
MTVQLAGTGTLSPTTRGLFSLAVWSVCAVEDVCWQNEYLEHQVPFPLDRDCLEIPTWGMIQITRIRA